MTTLASKLNPIRSTTWLSYLALLVGIVSLGFSAIFVRLANAPGGVSGFYRMAIATGVMAVPFAVQAKRRAPLSWKHVGFALLGGVFFACDLAAWNTSVLLTNAANATLFGNTSPFWVSLGALILFKEKLQKQFWIGLGITMLGAITILGGDFILHPHFGRGDMLALLAGFFYGLFFLVSQRARENLGSLLVWWLSALSSSVVLLGYSLLARQALTGYPPLTYWSLIGLALITQVGGYLSITYALGHLPASMVSPTMLGQPVMTALLALFILHEPLSWVQIFGGALVLGGIWALHQNK